MKILMTNHSMREPGGTQTWCKTVANELIRRGHEVELFTFMTGPASEQMPCPVITDPGNDYDLCIVNHNTCLGAIQAVEAPKIFTSHGPAHPLEHAARGADYYVAVSEEVRMVNASFGIHSRIIRNPVDLDLFDRKRVDPRTAGDVLVLCKNGDASNMATSACHRLRLTCTTVHYQNSPAAYEQIPLLMSRHKAVITSGRGVYEALACGCAPLVFDVRSGRLIADGWVREDNIADLVQFNCSGRARNLVWSESDLMDVLKSYDLPGMDEEELQVDMAWGREWVNEYHDVKKAVDAYFSMAGVEDKNKEEMAA